MAAASAALRLSNGLTPQLSAALGTALRQYSSASLDLKSVLQESLTQEQASFRLHLMAFFPITSHHFS